MTTIRFVDGEQREFTTLPGSGTDDDPPIAFFTHHEGTSDTPQLVEVIYPPDSTAAPHAHENDEILVVTQGECTFGARTYGVGSSVFIPKMTLYSFHAGPEGVTLLNFRPTITGAAIYKDEYLALRPRPAPA